MWTCPQKYETELEDLNEVYLNTLVGELSDNEARLTLIKFLRHNLTFTVELLTGIKIAPFQEVTLRGMLNRNYSMCIWGRGCGKTFIAAVFCILQCIFYPGSKILIAGPTFRTSRFIFNKIEEISERRDAALFFQVLGAKIKRNDLHELKINEGSIVAIPLNGEKIRGFRANVLLIDEYLLMSKEIVDTVLIPFLTAPQDMDERIRIRNIEDSLIKERLLNEKDRIIFENTTRFVALSSASYTFENLYETYCEWISKINKPKEKEDNAKYFISQLSWEALPAHMINQSIIKEAETGGTSNAVFLREYCARFTDGSEGYFAAKKMFNCTVPHSQSPHTLVRGTPDKKYVLAIDPSFSNSPTSDDFGMALLELDEENKQSTLVHAYGEHGKDLKEHIRYFYYLLTHFNIVFIVIDNAGYNFIDAANEHELFVKNKLNLKWMTFESSLDEPDYSKELKTAKRQHNLEHKRIVFKQVFGSNEFIRKSNEHLQGNIDFKRIWFASKSAGSAMAFDKAITSGINFDLIKGVIDDVNTVGDFIEHLDSMIDLTKSECALIEVGTNARGMQTFDLPAHLNRETTENRARKDNYTALLLGNWATKIYFDMQNAQVEEQETFVPTMI
jgi:hypothetical protein